MKEIGAYEAKTHLSRLLERVAKGDTYTITKHGVPIASLQPFDFEKNVDVSAVIDQIRNFREKNSLDGLSIKEMIEEGRR